MKSWWLDEAFQFTIITPTYTELADICSRKADIGATLLSFENGNCARFCQL